MNTLALFILDDAGEAYDVLHFCSEECREVIQENTGHRVVAGISDEWIDGTECDECGKPLTRIA